MNCSAFSGTLFSAAAMRVGDNISVQVVSVRELDEYFHDVQTPYMAWGPCLVTLLGVAVALWCHHRALRAMNRQHVEAVAGANRRHDDLLGKNTAALKANHDLQKKLAAMKAVRDTLEKNQPYNIRGKYRQYYSKSAAMPIETFDKLTVDEQDNIRYFLNSLEALAVGIRQNIYDEGTVRDAYRTTICLSELVFSPYIESLHTQVSYATAYEVLQWLAKRWRPKIEDKVQEIASADKFL